MNAATMKCWSVTSDQNGFKPQELVKYHLQGFIYSDSSGRFADGVPIRTSSIRNVIDHGTHKIVVTKNTEYTVTPDDVDPDYERKFPGAYERMPIRLDQHRFPNAEART